MERKQIWSLAGNSVVWNVSPGQIHHDHYEMSGLYCDMIIGYGVDESGMLLLDRSYYFPTLRTIPNDTHATLEARPDDTKLPSLCSAGRPIREYPVKIQLDGTLNIRSRTNVGVWIQRQFFPAADARCGMEIVTVTAAQAAMLSMSAPRDQALQYTLGTKGCYVSRVRHNGPEQISLLPGDSFCYSVAVSADIGSVYPPMPDGPAELERRYRRIRELSDDALLVDTGIEEIDAIARFAKLRAGESIFETRSGKFHSPGGRTYYAAIWCNDQIEYAGPYFASTGDRTAVEASLNAYRAYVPYMAENYAPIPSSIIAEGLDIWNGAGDRGDAAMYLNGASLFALYLGNREIARELYTPIRWCAEYCFRRQTKEGVISSDTDELENRIPTDGYANLSTSCLCYGGLLAAAKLADSLDDTATAADYRSRAAELKTAILSYFSAELHGYATFRYSRGFDTLRAWICLPMCVGITERSEGTLDAMFSDYLWTSDGGMLSCELSSENRDSTTWDRSTLYGFKAAFLAGQGDRVLPLFLDYCRKRLLGDRVPYAVEAYPEGDKRHLSGESALLMRMITEGILGLQPEGLKKFSFMARLPAAMPHLNVSKLRILGHCWDIHVSHDGWRVWQDGALVAEGQTDGKRVTVHVSNKE